MRFIQGWIMISVIALVPLVQNASAQEPADDADYAAAIEALVAGLDIDDPQALFGYALLQLEGIGVPKNSVSAGRMLKEAAAKGELRAAYLLSQMLTVGEGMGANPQKALVYLNQAADGGLPDALFDRAENLADSDPDAAMLDIITAAKAGHTRAIQVLATLNFRQEIAAPPSNQSQNSSVSEATPHGKDKAADKGASGSDGLDLNNMIAIQALLRQAGFDPGPPNGELTSQTITAIVLYQIEKGLETNGKPSLALRDHLIDSAKARP